MIEWKKLFDEMHRKILNNEWDMGDVVEVLNRWRKLAETIDSDIKQLADAYKKFQQSGWEDTEKDNEECGRNYEDFVRVCEKTLC